MKLPAITPGPYALVQDAKWPGLWAVSGPSFQITFWTLATDITEADARQRMTDAKAIAAVPSLLEALNEARAVIQDERDNMVESATAPPEHDLATLDSLTKPYVEQYDAALARIVAALRLAGATE